MNIYQRINEVRKKISYVRKDKEVRGSGYMAVTHDAVTALTREAFIEQGILIVPSLVSSRTVDTGTVTKSGTPFIRMEAVYSFDVVNADEPSDRFNLNIEAHALDQGDKAPGKALSYAKKYCVLKLLEIESGEDEEGRAEQHKAKAAKSVAADAWEGMTEKQKTALTDAAMEVMGFLQDGEDARAFECYVEHRDKLNADEQVALWSRFDAEQRTTIKRMGEAYKREDARRKERKNVG